MEWRAGGRGGGGGDGDGDGAGAGAGSAIGDSGGDGAVGVPLQGDVCSGSSVFQAHRIAGSSTA